MKDIYLKSKVGIKWTVTSNIVISILRTLTITILTLSLGPEKMGLISIIMVIYTLSEILTQFGVSQAIISSTETTGRVLSSIFWINQAIGCLVFSCIFLLSPSIASFYNQPQLINNLRILSIIFFLEPLDLVFRAILQKEINFPILEKVNITKSISISISTILLILLDFEIKGFVFGLIIGAFIDALLLSYYFIKNKLWFPSLHFSFEEIKTHYSFGLFVTATALINYMGRNFDELIIGKIYGVKVLGLYYFAKNILAKITSMFVTSLSKVTFPLYSKLKTDLPEFKKLYLFLSHVVASLGFFIFGMVFVGSPFAIPTIWGVDWSDSVMFIQAFSVIACLDILSSGFASPALYVFNKPKFVFKVDLIFTPLRILLIFLASLISIKTVFLVFFTIVLSKILILQRRVNKEINSDFSEYYLSIKKPLQSLLLSFLCYFLINILLESNNQIVYNILKPSIFMFAYSVQFILGDLETFKVMKKEIIEIFLRKKPPCVE